MTHLQRHTARRLIPFLLALALAAVPAVHAAPESSRPTSQEKARAKAKAKKAAQVRQSRSLKVKKPAPKVDYAGEQINFGEWQAVTEFAHEMVTLHGFESGELKGLIGQVRFVDSAVQLVKPRPPGKPKNWQAVSDLFIEPVRINAGIAFWNEHADTLARAEAEFGVPAEIIVGIIGVETVYGRNTGRFRVMDVLTTLAFAYPEAPNRDARMAFFRGELKNTLLLARKQNIDPMSLLGSFAGAVGMPQFMPGSILAYAVDFDGDGRIDLRNSAVDSIGSVANFLVMHGWQRDQPEPIVYPAIVSPSRAWEIYIGQGLEAKFTADEFASAGVVSSTPLAPGLPFGLVDLQNGAEPTEYWLATNNFFAITKYNRSYFYAMSVIKLGRTVRAERGF